MAEVAICGKSLIDLVHVAGRAFSVAVGSGKSKCCHIVFERARCPRGLAVAVAAFRTHLAEVDVILLVAIHALNSHSLNLCVGSVALGTRHLIVVAL